MEATRGSAGVVGVDPWLPPIDHSTASLAALIAANHEELLEREARVLQLACAWADAYGIDDSWGLVAEAADGEARCWGGAGTPEVSEFAAVEFATLQRTTINAGRMLLADALDLRHRLPRLWALLLAGQVRGWQGRQVAQQTRRLDVDAVERVDAETSTYLPLLPWARFQRLLTATILEVDPAAAAERELRAHTERTVWTSESEHGLRTLVARAAAGDVVWFMATVNRIAEILATEGDLDSVGVRRAKAVGLLAHPVQAVTLLARHRHDSDDPEGAAEPVAEPAIGPDPQAPGDSECPGRPTDPVPYPDDDLLESLLPDPMPEPDRISPDEAFLTPGGSAPELEYLVRPPADRAEVDHVSLTADLPGHLDPSRLRPTVVLHFHLSDVSVLAGRGVVRPEHGDIVTLRQLQDFLSETDCVVRVQPVFAPGDVPAVDAYEIPPAVRRAVRERNVADTFPYGSGVSAGLDLDHSIPYRPAASGGPAGQTGIHNLGPLSRPAHRAVTHGRWKRRQPSPGVFLYRSPHGYTCLTTNQGTLDLGHCSYADAAWRAAAPKRAAPVTTSVA